MTARRVVLAGVVALSVAALFLSASLPGDNPNAFIALFFLELLLVPAAGVLALARLIARPESAPGLTAAGLYALVVGAALVLVIPAWNPSDNAFLGLGLLGGLAAGTGAGLAIAGALLLGGRSLPAALGGGAAAGILAGLVVLAGGVVYPAARARAPLLAPIVVAPLAVALAGSRRGDLGRPLIVAAVAAAATIAAFLIRGESDWATTSPAIRLYSFPIVVLALALGGAIAGSGRTVR